MSLLHQIAEEAGTTYAKVVKFHRHALIKSSKRFAGFFFRVTEDAKVSYSWHHKAIHDTLRKVRERKITRLIINIPPGYGKTQFGVVNFVAECMAEYPACRFLHLSFSDSLVLTNSVAIKDTMSSSAYQALWPTKLRKDVNAKSEWMTDKRGWFQAISTGGAVTGRRAGRMVLNKFTGAMLIDDPLKPDDAFSDVKRDAVNQRYNNTLRSRLAFNKYDGTPVIIIMQRLHDNDLAGFLLKGGTGEVWDHLVIPAFIPPEGPWCFHEYPAKWTHGRPIQYEYKLGPTWPFKQDEADLMLLKASDPYTYSSQSDQRPVALGKGMFKREWWTFHYGLTEKGDFVIVPNPDGTEREVHITYKMIYADTASKTNEWNDYSVFQMWGKGADGRIYLLDQVRGKWEAHDLYDVAIDFFDRGEFDNYTNLTPVRGRKVEDASSGTGLIQTINSERGAGYIEGILREKDKVTRAMGIVKFICKGQVVLPAHANWIEAYMTETDEFSPQMTHEHDDQLDPTMDAIEDMLVESSSLYDNVS